MADHLPDTAIDDYIDDALDEAARASVEAHTRTCETCAARLARAAQAELALLEVASEAPRRRRLLRWPIVGAAAAIAAAAVALIAVQRAREPAQQDARHEVARVEPEAAPEGPAFGVTEDSFELPSTAELTTFVPEGEP